MRIIKVTPQSKVTVKTGEKLQKDGVTKRPWKLATQTVRMYDVGSCEDSDALQINIPDSVLVERSGQEPVGYLPGLYVWDTDLHIERRAFDAPMLSMSVGLIPLTKEYYHEYMNRTKNQFEGFLKS